jgi:putative hemolysin
MQRKIGTVSALVALVFSVLPASSSNAMLLTVAPAVNPPHAIVTIGMQGGFVAPSWQASRLPQLVVYSNGLIYSENQKPAHGYVRELLVSRVSASVATNFAAKIYALSQTPKGGWGLPPVADVPDTTIQVASAGRSRMLSIFALNFSGPAMPAVQAKARQQLSAAITKFETSAAKLAHGVTLQPKVFEVWGLTQLIAAGNQGDGSGPVVGMANPASVYCESIGGTSVITNTDAGQAGACQLPSGETVDEWVNYRKALATLPGWPEGYTVPQADYNTPNLGCTVIAAASLAKQLANKSDEGRWLLPSGQAFPVVLRPVLSGERPCHRVY